MHARGRSGRKRRERDQIKNEPLMAHRGTPLRARTFLAVKFSRCIGGHLGELEESESSEAHRGTLIKVRSLGDFTLQATSVA
jgi:hypothetical protein